MPEPQTLTAEAFIHGMIACRANARDLIADAEVLAEHGRYARAYALLHTACEELGKFAMLEIGASGLFRGKPPQWKRFWQRFRSHDSKSAQLEVQLLMLAVSSSETDDFTDSAETLFSRGIQVRNAALYVDLGSNKSFRQPSDLNFDTPVSALRALAAHALTAADQRGSTHAEIEAYLKAPPTPDRLHSANLVFVKSIERMRDAGVEKEKVVEIINKRSR